MKKLIILITAWLITITASAQITNQSQIPQIYNDQKCIIINNDGTLQQNTDVNQALVLLSNKINSNVIIVETKGEVYSKFFNDFFSNNTFNNNYIALCIDGYYQSYYTQSYGDIKQYEQDINDIIESFLSKHESGITNEILHTVFIKAVEDVTSNNYDANSNQQQSAAVDLPADDWAKYTIAQRTEQNPYVFKSFLKGQLSNDQMQLALETPYVDTAVKVYDAANLLTDNEIANLQKRIHQFVNQHNVDMVVVTINHNNKKANNGNIATENFAMDFYEYNDFGKGEQTKAGYDGVILVIDMGNRKFSILDVGKPHDKYNVASYFYEDYINKMAPDLTSKNYYKAINTFIESYESDYIYESTFPWWKCSIISLLVGLVMLTMEKSKYKNIRKATSAANYVKEGSFRLTVKKDTFVSTHTTKVYSPPSKSSGGGSHSSSSGRSFGGGSGSF